MNSPENSSSPSDLHHDDQLNQQIVSVDQFNELNEFGTIREELINVAINFLLNPKVKSSPLFQKRHFLAQKGLTQEEIDVALDRFLMYAANEIAGANNFPIDYHQRHSYHQSSLPVPIVPSFWLLTKAITPPVIVVGSALYGLYWLYVHYIRPFLYGKRTSTVELLREEIGRLSDQLLKLQNDITRIEYSIKSNFEHELAMVRNGGGGGNGNGPSPIEMAAIGDLKNDISSIKAMILSKDRFPSTPSSSLSIPSWQLANKDKSVVDTQSLSSKEQEEQRKPTEPSSSPEMNSDSTCKSDSTFEIISASSTTPTIVQGQENDDLIVKERSDSNSSSKDEIKDDQVGGDLKTSSLSKPSVVTSIDGDHQTQQSQSSISSSSSSPNSSTTQQGKHSNKHRAAKKNK